MTVGNRKQPIDADDLPQREQQDWEALESANAGSARTAAQSRRPAGMSLEEEDDNPFQVSDEALPDDEVEEAIEENLERSSGRFEE